MQTVRCVKGHSWAQAGQETVAVCPVCGGAPTVGDPAKPTPENPDQTIGDGSVIRPFVQEEGTIRLPPSQEGGNEDPAAPDDATLGHFDARPDQKDDKTLGSGTEQEDLTIGVPPDATCRDAVADRTLGVDEHEANPDDIRTLKEGSARGETPKFGNGGDNTGNWDLDGPTRPATFAQGPDRTIPGGGATPGASPLFASASKTGGRKRKDRKDPLGGKTVVAGYEILGELGRGGMGVVYKARQPGANRVVALKMVLNSGHAGKETLARFHIEAEAVAQLQHANIVQLYEVGEEDGCPFFSLEFIEGNSLARKIESTPQPPREAAQLVQRLAEGMYYAHQRGIIHRDLKPANILLTRDGVPKITDFGLAKRFEDKGEGQTRTGAIMGTPSYMAPEQAQGRTKYSGPAADVYSLGAILYDMLTGRPPFRGTTLLETLQQVQTVEPVPPMRLQPSLPSDLQTICLKALEKDPQRRYHTAGALAEDLRRFQAGEPILARPTPWYERGWKWAKRRPAVAGLVVVSVLGLVGLLTLGGLWLDTKRRAAEADVVAAEELASLAKKREAEQIAQARKEKALRQVAEKNFKRAKLAVDQMLTEVGQERLRNIPHMEKVRRDLLKKAKIFYDEFLAEQSADPDMRWEAGLAQQRVADILEKLGDSSNALKAYDSALGLFQGLAREHPKKLQYQRDLAILASSYGNLLKDLKRNRDAEKNYRRALELRRLLHDRDPRAADLSLELAKSHNNLANVLYALGRQQEAEAELHATRALLTQLVKDERGTIYQAELARTLDNLGSLQKTWGPAGTAEHSYDQANKILSELAAREPEVPAHRQDLAYNHFLLADLLRDTDAKKAAEHYRQSIKLRGQLAKDFPDTPTYRQELAGSYSGLAILLQALGKQKEADEAYGQALDLQQKIVKDFPHLPDYRRSLASSFNNRGIMLLGGNRHKEGEAALVKAMELWNALGTDYPDIPEYAMELAGTYLNLGAVWQASQPKNALDVGRRALALRRKLAEKNPEVPVHQEELARTEGNLGLMLLSREPQEAKSLFGHAVEIFTKLARANPKNPDYRHQLAVSHNNLGNALRVLNDPKEAEAAWRRSIDLYQDLVHEFEDVPSYAEELGKRYNELGIFLVSARRLPDAEKAWQAGMAVQERLLARSPRRPEYRMELGRSEGNLGILYVQAGDNERAEQQYRKGIALLEEYEPKLGTSPALAGYVGELIKIHSNLANLMAALNKPAEAEKSWLRQLELREKLAKAFPQVPSFRLEAVAALNELGNRVVQNQQFSEAKAFYEKAVWHLRELTKGPDTAPEMWTNLYLMQLNLATSVVALKEYGAAAQVIRDMAPQAPPSARQDHVAAAILARCAGLAAKDSGLADGKRAELAKMYGAEAIALLRQAMRNGFRDAGFLRTSDDFQALRDREDFQQVLKDLPASKN